MRAPNLTQRGPLAAVKDDEARRRLLGARGSLLRRRDDDGEVDGEKKRGAYNRRGRTREGGGVS